jgi:DNA-binding CsgD family transcriptional regulator/tetratricopeptide (TPR) repeat protein
LIEADSVRTVSFLDSLENSPNAKGYFFRTYFSMVKADVLYAKFAGYDKYKDRKAKELQPIKEQMMKLYADALDAVYHTEKDLAIGWVSFYSAKRMLHLGETGWAVMYSKNGVDLFEKDGYDVEPPVYTDLAELLYQVREYDESIMYAKKGLNAWRNQKFEKDYKNSYKFKIKALNTIGSTFYKKNRYDSANTYFQKALQLANKYKDTLWKGKLLGNIGRIIYAQNKFDSAYYMFQTDYQTNMAGSLYNDAASASQWMAKTNLGRGNRAAALTEAKEAVRLLCLWPNGPYLRDTYNTLTEIFRAMGNYDSAFYYNRRYMAIHDSLEREIVTSSLAISKARLNDEVSRFNIQRLNREKRAQLVVRNFIIAGIVLLFLIALLILNRKRLKEKMKKEKVEQEMNWAKEQMRLFTDNIIEKTSLIEKLELQVKRKQDTSEQQLIIAELNQQTILTEDDWLKFKSLFEKIHPAFFASLKQKVSDITVAEQRMAALTRLQLTSKQMASMLGISVDSVHKTRQRLRQRLQLGSDINLEEYVSNI